MYAEESGNTEDVEDTETVFSHTESGEECGETEDDKEFVPRSEREYSVQEVLDELLTAQEEEPARVYHPREEEKVDIMGYLNEDALNEIDEKCADIEVTPTTVSQDTDLEHTQVFDIGSTRVFAPVTENDGYVDEPYETNRYASVAQTHSKPRKRAGLLQIAVLLVVVAGITWLVSKAAFSVMGRDQNGDAQSVPYDDSSSDTVIKTFDDGMSDTVSSDIPEFNTNQLSEGDTGELVSAVQRRLNLFGYLASESVSGTYNKATAAAVRQFQKANGLEQNGIVDKATFDAIFDNDAATQTTVTTLLPITTVAETTTTPTTGAITDAPTEETTQQTTQQTTVLTESTTMKTTAAMSSDETDATKSTSTVTETMTSTTTESTSSLLSPDSTEEQAG